MYDKILEILSNEQLVSAIIVVVGALWTLVKGTGAVNGLIEWTRDRKLNKIFDLATVAANHSYQNYVVNCKKQNPGGKLTELQRKEAMKLTID